MYDHKKNSFGINIRVKRKSQTIKIRDDEKKRDDENISGLIDNHETELKNCKKLKEEKRRMKRSWWN